MGAKGFSVVAIGGLVILLGGQVVQAQDVPTQIEELVGEIGVRYDAVRIDLIPDSGGGPREIVLDGELDEDVWKKAAKHYPPERWKGGMNTSIAANVEDFSPVFQAAADENFLYVAWEIIDETLQVSAAGCAAFHDDAIEFYIDMGNEKEANSYDANSIQADVPASNILGSGNPDELVTGAFKRGGCVGDQIINTETNELIFRGVVTELAAGQDVGQIVSEGLKLPYADGGDGPDATSYSGWQGEVAIGLQQISAIGEWNVIPDDGVRIGLDVHFTDDDIGVNQGGQTKAQIWSLNDPNSQAWGNPQVFAELQFVQLGVGPFVRGDCNGDGGTDLSDGVTALNFSFLGAEAPGCLAACSFNASGELDITNAVFFFNVLFQGSGSIPDPTGTAGGSKVAGDLSLGCANPQI